MNVVRTSRAGQVLDVVAGCAVRIHARDVDAVTGSRRDVIDRQSQLSSPAPFIVGMAICFDAKRRVVRRMIVMRGERGLEQTPRLVYAEHGDQIRIHRSSEVTGAERAERTGRSENTSTGNNGSTVKIVD